MPPVPPTVRVAHPDSYSCLWENEGYPAKTWLGPTGTPVLWDPGAALYLSPHTFTTYDSPGHLLASLQTKLPFPVVPPPSVASGGHLDNQKPTMLQDTAGKMRQSQKTDPV